MSKKTLRPAIAMIELIFAIVIIGITLMSAPMLISTATKSGYVAIQQESINEAASHVNMIMGYQWDENDVNELYIDPILRVSSSGDSDLNEDNNTARRLGTPKESYRTFVRSDSLDFDASVASALGNDGGDRDDIDDFIGIIHLTPIETSAETIDYVETITIDINTIVAYIPDSPTGSGSYATPASRKISFTPDFASSTSSTNIKRIRVTLTSNSTAPDELEKKIILNAFSCNIGGYKLEEKEF